MKTPRMFTKEQVQELLLYTIAVIFVGIGVYHGAIGYSKIMETPLLAWLFMLAIGLGMLLMEFRLKDQLEDGARWRIIGTTILLYTFLALINMMGNFNTFFTNPIREQLVAKERERVKTELKELNNYVVDILFQRSDTTALYHKAISLVEELEGHLVNEDDPGIGGKAQVMLDSMAALSGSTITPRIRGNVPLEVARAEFEWISALFMDRIKLLMTRRNQSRVAKELRTVEQTSGDILTRLDAGSGKHTVDEAESMVLGAVSQYNNMLGLVRSLEPDAPFEQLTTQIEQIGTFPATLRAVQSGEYRESAWIAFWQSFFIDFIVLAIFLGAVRRKAPQQESQMEILQTLLVQAQKKMDKQGRTIAEAKRTIADLKRRLGGDQRRA